MIIECDVDLGVDTRAQLLDQMTFFGVSQGIVKETGNFFENTVVEKIGGREYTIQYYLDKIDKEKEEMELELKGKSEKEKLK